MKLACPSLALQILWRDWFLRRIQWKTIRHLMIEPENRGDGFCIPNGSAQDHANGGGQREQALLDHFVGLGLRFTGTKSSGEIYRHGFGNEAGAGVKVKNATPVCSGVSRLFEEFAFSRIEGLYAGLDPSSRHI